MSWTGKLRAKTLSGQVALLDDLISVLGGDRALGQEPSCTLAGRDRCSSMSWPESNFVMVGSIFLWLDYVSHQ